ncbi:hypothetical protein [Halorussus aquaticus]|uniref:Uncharacterized protein n=1 Tax=Halorussus aquaticus TaxID=2953748 RepID=A0ABD5Q0G6_9EURY|nr:hypothetical protein [Halorussus aquaticus]
MQFVPLRVPGTPWWSSLLVALAVAGLWRTVRWLSTRLRAR